MAAKKVKKSLAILLRNYYLLPFLSLIAVLYFTLFHFENQQIKQDAEKTLSMEITKLEHFINKDIERFKLFSKLASIDPESIHKITVKKSPSESYFLYDKKTKTLYDMKTDEEIEEKEKNLFYHLLQNKANNNIAFLSKNYKGLENKSTIITYNVAKSNRWISIVGKQMDKDTLLNSYFKDKKCIQAFLFQHDKENMNRFITSDTIFYKTRTISVDENIGTLNFKITAFSQLKKKIENSNKHLFNQLTILTITIIIIVFILYYSLKTHVIKPIEQFIEIETNDSVEQLRYDKEKFDLKELDLMYKNYIFSKNKSVYLKLLEDSIKSRNSTSDLLDKIAHQLKQPITGIIGEASRYELFDKRNIEYTKETSSESFKAIEHHARVLTDTIDTFVNFHKSTNIKPEKYDILEALDISEKSFADEFKKNNIKFEIIASNEISSRVYGNRSLFYHMIAAILQNAIEQFVLHCQKQKEKNIQVILSQKEKDLEVIIKDNAGGIKTKFLNKIMEKGFSTKKDITKYNSGLGLSIVKQIAKDLGIGFRYQNHQFEIKDGINGKGFMIILSFKYDSLKELEEKIKE